MKKNNENRPGYKKTEVGWIPEEWGCKQLDTICIKGGEYGAAAPSIDYESNFPRYIRITDITDDGRLINHSIRSIEPEKAKGYILLRDDFLFARSGATVGKTYLHEKDGLFAYAGYLIRYIPDPNQLSGQFLSNFTHSGCYRSWINSITRAGAQPNINAKEYSSLYIPVPPINEQFKVAKVLSAWDGTIDRVQRLIEAKQQLKYGLMQGLVTGKRRFSEFGKPIQKMGDLPKGWRWMSLGQLLKRARKPVEVHPEQVYREIGIRSHGKGIFHKEERPGEAIGAKSVFWVEPDCFVLNIVFAWEQAVARTTIQEEGMVASHRFPMYQPLEEVLDLDYLVKFFLTPHGKSLLGLVSPGGAGRNKTLNQDAFLKLSMPVPTIDEQKKIVNTLLGLEREIEILSRYQRALQSQKQGLMQRLLTGEIRVKVS